MTDFFTKEAAQGYDARNTKLAAISAHLHFLLSLLLQALPLHARILCVGVGTGAEILALAEHYPGWRFTGVDPSAPMLEVCQRNLMRARIADRCELITGTVQDLPEGESYDAALSILVAHFVPKPARLDFFQNMVARLRPGGVLVNAEISGDLDAPDFGEVLKDWTEVQKLMGATSESLAALPAMIRDKLAVLPPLKTEALLRQSGLAMPIPFLQSFMIHGWHGRKA